MVGRKSGQIPQSDDALIITGASGFLGYNLLRHFQGKYKIIATRHVSPVTAGADQIIRLDLNSGLDSVEQILKTRRVKAIIHAAAMALPDECEKQPDLTFRINTRGSVRLIHSARAAGCRFFFISTDLVYGSGGKGPFTEDSAEASLVYSHSKLDAEKAILETDPNAIIFRCALMYGDDDGIHGSFVRKMLESVKQRKHLTLFTDQIRTPVWAPDIAAAVERCIQSDIEGGVYNLGGPDRITRYDFGMKMAEIFGWDTGLIRPVRISDLPHLVFRSHDCSLDSSKAIHAMNYNPTPVSAGLRMLKKAWDRR